MSTRQRSRTKLRRRIAGALALFVALIGCGALSSGKFAPKLDGVSEKEIYAAMLTGPENMPKFSDRQLTPEEKKDIIAYVKSVTDGNNNPGGNAIGGLGPQSEGLIAFVVGIAALVGVSMWIGAKS